MICQEDAVKLRGWQRAASAAAKAVVRGVVQQGLIVIANKMMETAPPAHDLGKKNVSDWRSFGGG